MRFIKFATSITLSLWCIAGNAQDIDPEIVIANPNATFIAQQRALPSAEVIAAGDVLYQVNCRLCHGPDLRGGDGGGPNLLRSGVVLNDVAGEVIGEVVSEGVGRMPAFGNLNLEDIAAVAGYIHSVVATSERQGSTPPVDYDLDILVGDVTAGERYFNQECVSCHSVTGDLQGISSRITDPYALQDTWVAGGQGRRSGRGGAQTTATVILATGEQVSGRLLRYDDFFISLRTAQGAYRSFTRRGDTPGIELDDPLTRHKELWAELTDGTIHDVTAYLETLK
ncbi:MAG: cytochrome C [Gammaproteobacteria bacterium]|jgi:cytochrome c oxidase cbb3-type subunit 3|nr:cytochrome C [Gammaproteobacteria bacterium]HJN95487.1 cytochrome c [Gammaproteobacteria bacterium]|tara:strand:- start:19334 stop:20179 length:846 start_codon:yes stop_codon:yes gene_type:complete